MSVHCWVHCVKYCYTNLHSRCEEGSRRKGVVNVELDVIYMNEDKLKYMEGVVSGMGNLGVRMVSCI